jgi:hypothetical protein
MSTVFSEGPVSPKRLIPPRASMAGPSEILEISQRLFAGWRSNRVVALQLDRADFSEV